MQEWLTPSLALSAAAFGLAVGNAYYTRKRDSGQDNRKELDTLRKDLEGACNRIAKVESRLEVLEMKMDLYWSTVAQQMAKRFTEQ